MQQPPFYGVFSVDDDGEVFNRLEKDFSFEPGLTLYATANVYVTENTLLYLWLSLLIQFHTLARYTNTESLRKP